MKNAHIEHPDEEMLERFLLHRSRADELGDVETHILACQYCLDCLETMELRIRDLQVALATESENEIENEQNPIRSRWKSWFTLPSLSWAGAACAALVLGLVLAPRDLRHPARFSSMPDKAEAANGYLSINRGINSTTLPKGRPLNLHLDTTDIAEGRVNVQVVNGTGGEIWRGHIDSRKEGAEARLPRILQPGVYFLRLYQAGGTSEHELLREFRFELK